ncbi:MAG TPA: hypothetical protein VGX51_03060 [Solirubrobacteraceae bacterium]|nr:hypothetical protein [Solirubrobacteraceae bacterium]
MAAVCQSAGSAGPCAPANWRFASARGLVLATGQPVMLSVREFELLAATAQRQGSVVTREELYSAA